MLFCLTVLINGSARCFTSPSPLYSAANIRHKGCIPDCGSVAISVHSHNRTISHVRIQIQTLRVTELGVRNGRGLGGPVWGHEAPRNVRIIPGTEIVQL